MSSASELLPYSYLPAGFSRSSLVKVPRRTDRCTSFGQRSSKIKLVAGSDPVQQQREKAILTDLNCPQPLKPHFFETSVYFENSPRGLKFEDDDTIIRVEKGLTSIKMTQEAYHISQS